MKFHLVSLGCPKNLVDSEQFAADLLTRGWSFTEDEGQADLVFVNTCGFIKDAKEESLEAIMRLVRLKEQRPEVKVCAFGCLIKRYAREIKEQIPELDHLFDFQGPGALTSFLPILESQLHPNPGFSSAKSSKPKKTSNRLFTPPHIGYLKISEGCSNRCTYCAIPGIRGDFRSRPLRTVMADAHRLVETGAREIIVVAQDTTRFGTDLDKHVCLLPDLLEQLGQFPEVRWIRLQYLHPARLNPELLDRLFHLPKVLPYFDIPFQHAADPILERMNRGVSKAQLIELLKHIRWHFRKSVIRTTFIVGFPGETQAHFEELCDFVEDYPLDRVGAFPYSPEEGTPSAGFRGKVPQKTISDRLDELMTLQQMLATDRNQKWVGKTLEVLVDRIEEDQAIGRTFGDSPEVDNETRFPYKQGVQAGHLVNVHITAADAYDFTGELAK